MEHSLKTDRKAAEVAITCERLLYTIVTTLVFEGLIRKVLPSAIGLVVFFTKDFLCLYAIYIVATVKLPTLAVWINTQWKMLAILFIPLLIYTAFLDLPLSVFAAKQYLLYAGVSLLVPLAFHENRGRQFKRFAFFFALLLIPTTTVAIIQNSLPASHWLNLSADGGSLLGFGAAGFMRVSSTFSFTGQYGWFLNTVFAFIILGLFMPSSASQGSFFRKIVILLVSGTLLIIGIFITGGRTAVFGNAGCIIIGFALSTWKSPFTSARNGLLAGLLLIPSFWLLHELKPEFFAAYEARSAGTEEVSNQDEMQTRIFDGYTDWLGWYGEQDIASMLIGNGLGVMSNGSDRISTYAHSVRATGLWMEGDVSATVWEGGIYLMLLWYGFRFAIILFCVKLWHSMKTSEFSILSSFMLANVIINGISGNITMQPPVAIWWWLSVGTILAVHGFEREFVKKNITTNSDHLRHALSSRTTTAVV